jgi:hypothetical protein
MASFHLPEIRYEVSQYLFAGMSLLAGENGSHDEFMVASQALQQKTGKYTEEELALVNEVLHRVSVKLG